MSNETKILIGLIGIPTILIFLLGILYTTKTQPKEITLDSDAKIELQDGKTHDWGEIDITGGNVSKVFKIKNIGSKELLVSNFTTSCSCTETQVMLNGEKSPVFGMHTRSSWTGYLQSGETAEVLVVFDPLFHGPQGTGPITRLISFSTNDLENPKIELELVGNVVNKNN